MDRKSLRTQLLEERSKMDANLLQELGDRISDIVTESDWYLDSSVIHCFAGNLSKGEIATTTLLQHVIQSGRQLIMPRVTETPGVLSHHLVTDLASLIPGKWGIPEPTSGKSVSPGQIDLVLVPGLAADIRGNRIGYGMGYYDRFLAMTPARTMMLLPQCMVLDHIHGMTHDIPVHALATEHEIIVCHGNNTSGIP